MFFVLFSNAAIFSSLKRQELALTHNQLSLFVIETLLLRRTDARNPQTLNNS